MPYADPNSEAARASVNRRCKKYYQTHLEFSKKVRKDWLTAHPEKAKEYKRRWTLKTLEKSLERIKSYKSQNSEKLRNYERGERARTKRDFIRAYGGSCQCCGEDRHEFLTLDHVNGREQHEKGITGFKMYRMARAEGYPKDKYSLLCMNCNFAKGKFGGCPHQRERELGEVDSNTLAVSI